MESDISSCGICFESYNEAKRKPLLLPCSHSFCQTCLQTLENEGSKDCAFCKKSWGQTGIQNFPICYQLIPAGASAQGKPQVETCEQHAKEITFWCASCSLPMCNTCLEEKHSKCKFMLIEKLRDGGGQKDFERVVNDLIENMSQNIQLLRALENYDNELKKQKGKCLKWRNESQRRYGQIEEYCDEHTDGNASLQFLLKRKKTQEAFETLIKEVPTDTVLCHVARAYQKSGESSIKDFILSLQQSAEERPRQNSEVSTPETANAAFGAPFKDGDVWTIRDTTAGIKATSILRTTCARPSFLEVTGVNWIEEDLLKLLWEISELGCPVRMHFMDTFWTPERSSDKVISSRLQTLLKVGYKCTLTQFWGQLDAEGVKKLPDTIESVGFVLKGAEELKALKAINNYAFAYPLFFGTVTKKWTNLSKIHLCFAKPTKETELSLDKVWNAEGSRLVKSCSALDIQLGLHFPLLKRADLTWMTNIIKKVTDYGRFNTLVTDVYLPGAMFGADCYASWKHIHFRCQFHFPSHQLKDPEVIESYASIGCSVVWDLEAIHSYDSDSSISVPVVWKWIKDWAEPLRQAQ